MAGIFIPNTGDATQETVDEISNKSAYNQKIVNMNGLNQDFAHANKWVMYVPIANVLGKNYSNLELNIKRFSLPQMVMGSTTTSYKGYSYELPTKLIDADTKEVTIEYIVDEKWITYTSLFKWCSAMEGQINKVVNTGDVTGISMNDLLPCRIWLLDSFKNRIVDFVYENCWIKTFNDLNLETDNPDEITHSVTFAYSNFYIDTEKKTA